MKYILILRYVFYAMLSELLIAIADATTNAAEYATVRAVEMVDRLMNGTHEGKN